MLFKIAEPGLCQHLHLTYSNSPHSSHCPCFPPRMSSSFLRAFAPAVPSTWHTPASRHLAWLYVAEYFLPCGPSAQRSPPERPFLITQAKAIHFFLHFSICCLHNMTPVSLSSKHHSLQRHLSVFCYLSFLPPLCCW